MTKLFTIPPIIRLNNDRKTLNDKQRTTGKNVLVSELFKDIKSINNNSMIIIDADKQHQSNNRFNKNI